jgi:hypothetical protein
MMKLGMRVGNMTTRGTFDGTCPAELGLASRWVLLFLEIVKLDCVFVVFLAFVCWFFSSNCDCDACLGCLHLTMDDI